MNRNLTGIPGHVMSAIGAILSVFVLSIVILGPLLGYALSLAVFTFFALPMTFMMYSGGTSPFWKKINFVDWIWTVLSIVSIGYLIVNYNHILTRVEYVSEISAFEMTMGIIGILAVLEATRRAMGTAMAVIAFVLLLYVLFGNHLPSALGHAGFDFDWTVDTMYLTSKGIFGSPLWVVITLAFPFILYGVILEELGILQTFLDFSNRLLGNTPGAPAKTAIIAGTFVGMASGLPMSSTYLIGYPTIPEMKRVGYPARTAGAIAAVVGTAAQLMPPMLGVAAFIVAQYMGVPYIKVCQYTLLPALMFYFCFYCTVDFSTRKWGIKAQEAVLKTYSRILMDGFYIFIVTIGVLTYFLVMFYPVGLAALYACTLALLLGLIRKSGRVNVKMLYTILAKTGKTSVFISIACMAAGIITGLLVETGLNLKFANMVISIGRDNLFIALVLSAVAILILSMGMPSIPAYITGIAIFGPALMKLGILPAAAHIFCFYYAALYAITPPVAFASYAGAQIAGEDPFMTGLVACKLGIMTYVVPFLFVYNPALLLIPEYWNVWEVIRLIVFYLPGLLLFAAGLASFWAKKMGWVDTVVSLVGGILLLFPTFYVQIFGLAAFIYIFIRQDIFNVYLRRKPVAA